MKELKEGDDYYMNGSGLIVLTEKFHLDRKTKIYHPNSTCFHQIVSQVIAKLLA